ncbi:MAG TPA: metallophosphoesterase family protein [Planctomycetaceae bacterium]|nr:metallophosphoesterase family protein [Planctomycetaceae bacterium]
MRLLLFSDLHCDVAAARRIVTLAEQADVVVGAGDIGNVRRGLDVCIRVLRGIRCPAILVAGNNETTDELRDACRTWDSAHVLHGTGVTINGTSFFGLGGGIPVTPFGSWSYDITEEQAGKLLEPCPPGAVLISHSPPKELLTFQRAGKTSAARRS